MNEKALGSAFLMQRKTISNKKKTQTILEHA